MPLLAAGMSTSHRCVGHEMIVVELESPTRLVSAVVGGTEGAAITDVKLAGDPLPSANVVLERVVGGSAETIAYASLHHLAFHARPEEEIILRVLSVSDGCKVRVLYRETHA